MVTNMSTYCLSKINTLGGAYVDHGNHFIEYLSTYHIVYLNIYKYIYIYKLLFVINTSMKLVG